MLPAAAIARLHTVFAASAFLSALAFGCALHFHKITKNDVAQYPEEWFPSVSATIGDWYPERNIFQLLIALTSGPRFALVFLQYFLHHSSPSAFPTLVFLFGLIRTLACGGWVYITSSDDHDLHDFMMILYMVCNIPWMLGGIATTPSASRSVLRKRQMIAAGFFSTLIPLIYFFIQHKVHRIPGAYTHYAFFEWALIFFDVLYDSVAEQEFREAGLEISISITHANPKSPVGSNIPSQADTSPLSSQEKHEITKELPAPQTDDTLHASPDKPLADALKAALAPAPEHPTPSSKWRDALTFTSDVYLSYIFWSLFTSLIPTLFYFSVWKLGIAGHELALLSVLSPALLALSSPYKYIFNASSNSANNKATAESKHPAQAQSDMMLFAKTRAGQRALHLASLVGIAAYLVPSPGGRLAFVFVANMLAVMRQAVAWAGIVEGEGDIEYQAIVLGLGVLLSSVLKQANRSNNPVWPFINHKAAGYNKTGLLLAVLAIYEYSTRPLPATSTATSTTLTALSPASSRPTAKNVLRAALPLGSLLFCLHNLLSDPSTLIAWSWTGYENRLPRGPIPHLHGGLTVLAMAAGLLLANAASQVTPGHGTSTSTGRNNLSSACFNLKKLTSHPAWFAFGAGAAYAMYAYRDWAGYMGGLGVALFVMSVLPLGFRAAADAAVGGVATNKNTDGPELAVARVYTTALAVYCVLNLASIFTVAYAFVPGGVYLRERTDLVLVSQMACLLPLFNWSALVSLIAKKKAKADAPPVAAATTTTLSASPSSSSSPPSPLPSTSKNHKSHILIALALLPLFSLLTTLHRLPQAPPQPFKPGARIVNAGIWAVHFGIDNEGHDSQRGMMNLIRDMELDIVGLLETDLHRTAFGHRDLSRLIVEESNYNVDIGPGPNAHTWGCVLLTKFPIISTKHHLLPSPHGELAPAIEAVLDIYGTEVLVIVSHNGQEEDPLDRELQATALAEIMAASTRPVIFLGYVVTKPHAPRPSPYEIMVSEGNVHDIDADDLDRWCEYIFYRGLYRTSYARISHGIITDTETQIGQFVLPKHGHAVVNDTVETRYLRSRKELLPVEHWFPMEYYGDEKEGGVNGHYYHVFNTPLYYQLPEDAIV